MNHGLGTLTVTKLQAMEFCFRFPNVNLGMNDQNKLDRHENK